VVPAIVTVFVRVVDVGIVSSKGERAEMAKTRANATPSPAMVAEISFLSILLNPAPYDILLYSWAVRYCLSSYTVYGNTIADILARVAMLLDWIILSEMVYRFSPM
jgi:hypothetical protein